MPRNPDDYPRRGRVIGGRVVHALPAKGRLDPRYPRMRRIIANAACRKQFNLTRRADILSPDTPVSCVACCRALGLPAGPPAEHPAADRPTLEHPVDILRAAADVAEQFADAATPGPWASLDRGDRLIRDTGDDGPLEYVVNEPMSHEGNAAHIVLWQPPVARAVAVWLRATAATLARQQAKANLGLISADRSHEPALAVARALLTSKDNT